MTPTIKMNEMFRNTQAVEKVFSHLSTEVTIYDTTTYELPSLRKGDIVLAYEPIDYEKLKDICKKGALAFRFSLDPIRLRSNYLETKSLMGQ